MDAIPGDAPFIMMPDGRARLFSPSGLLDAPLPDALRAARVAGAATSSTRASAPTRSASPGTRPENPLAEPDDDRYPHVASTFRLTEHHTAGPMSRNLPWLAELQPEMFAEIDPVLARAAGHRGRRVDGDRDAAGGDRGAREGHEPRAAAADGRRTMHQVCLPWHWGTFTTNEQGVTGDAANDLIAMSGDPNVTIHESKAFRCDVRAGRREGETTERLAGVDDARAARPGRVDQPEPDSGAQTARPSSCYGGENREI